MGSNERGLAVLIFIALLLGIFLVCGVIGMFTWTYSVNKWCEILDRPERVGRGTGFLLGICPLVGQFSVPVAIVTWVVSNVIE